MAQPLGFGDQLFHHNDGPIFDIILTILYRYVTPMLGVKSSRKMLAYRYSNNGKSFKLTH